MRILGLDCSAKSTSCAVVEEGVILAESFVNTKLTHSETLLPMIDGMLQAAKIDLGSVDLLAVTHGPGSFTGLRIGAAAIKGLCAGAGLPCVGVSTLEATTWPMSGAMWSPAWTPGETRSTPPPFLPTAAAR